MKDQNNITAILLILIFSILLGCKSTPGTFNLAHDVKSETQRAWGAYVKYAWGQDELLPLSRSSNNWYSEPLYISLIDAYSTLKIMGLDEEASRIEHFVADTISFDKDIYVKTFEVNIRILGGLLSMYDMTGNAKILDKAIDLGDRLLNAFHPGTGLPYYYVNLATGSTRGDTVCVAEIGSFLLEMGVLSYYTADARYYQAAKRCARALFDSRSPIGLIGQDFSVTSGKVLDSITQIGCFTDSFYEYLYKAWLLFGDNELKMMWDELIIPIDTHIAYETDSALWYGVVNSYTGEMINPHVTLWDAYFPSVLALSGDISKSAKAQKTWDWLWNKHGLVPMGYNFILDSITTPNYHLNPEVIESAYYLWHFTQEQQYLDMVKRYWSDTKKYCRTDIAFTHIEDVRTMKQSDQLSTFFFAENLKYFYLAFNPEAVVNPSTHVFNTEAHPFKMDNFDKEQARYKLGIE
jgi:hypothetical protein